eukprot:TRINITY_DN11157_c0_g2_i1.p1 TRINITY_DN11157_c0_g2~~TRINITY_DN11157_c0_g2_i1.p1  ORF type:complete len:120 (-),score=12.37 TRINITY_DN11157_c0_g2_i1:11-370(-)
MLRHKHLLLVLIEQHQLCHLNVRQKFLVSLLLFLPLLMLFFELSTISYHTSFLLVAVVDSVLALGSSFALAFTMSSPMLRMPSLYCQSFSVFLPVRGTDQILLFYIQNIAIHSSSIKLF